MHVFLHVCLRFFLFFALITTGVSLKCEFCEKNGTSCSGDMMACPSKRDTCIVAVIEIISDGKKSLSTIKGCESMDICATSPFYLEMGNQSSYKASVACCTGNMCKIVAPQIPPSRIATNGKKCPSCYTTSGICGNETVRCTGLQKFCFDVTTVMAEDGKEQDYIIKGCTTQSVCAAILTNRSPILGDAIVKKATCVPNPTSGSASPGLFLSLFYGFLLLKILM